MSVNETDMSRVVNSSAGDLVSAMDQLMRDYQAYYQEHGVALVTERIEEWQMPIEVTGKTPPGDTDEVYWEPVRQAEALQFTDLERALEQPFHADFAAYYQRWFAADLAVTWGEHPLILLQVMCREDAERLLVNLAGHTLMKRRLKQPITLFLGLAEETDDLLITVANETGEVGLEFVGKPQHEILAPNLTAFLAGLQPRLPTSEQTD